MSNSYSKLYMCKHLTMDTYFKAQFYIDVSASNTNIEWIRGLVVNPAGCSRGRWFDPPFFHTFHVSLSFLVSFQAKITFSTLANLPLVV